MADTSISESLRNLTLTGVEFVGRDLGHGAYGKVVEVKYLGRSYAAKEIHTILLEETSPEEKRRVRHSFLQECRTCSELDHPNIVRFIGIFCGATRNSVLPAMVMELMDTSLTEYVERSSISMDTKVSILRDVSSGLNYLHNHTPLIIHRDLSPNNVLLSHGSVAKISDLGVAKVIKADSKRTKSKLTTAPGTLHFMPPEAIDENNPDYSTSLDVFSFGGITLHVVNQEWPEPTSSTAYDTKARKIRGFTEVERRQVHLDKMTDKVAVFKPLVIDCLDNDPAKRPKIRTVLARLESITLQINQPSYIQQGVPYYNRGNEGKGMSQMTYAVLLEDRTGHREPSMLRDFTKWAYGVAYSDKMVLAGNLLQILMDDEVAATATHFDPPLNYRVLNDSATKLYCLPTWIHPLTTRQKELLLAVNSPFDRATFCHNVEWVQELKEGSHVSVKVSYIDHPIKSVVHFIGKLQGEAGIQFGVEFIDKRGEGTTNGVFKGHRYFHCEQKCGMFVSMDKLVKCTTSLITKEPKTGADYSIKKGDKVTTYDDQGTQVSGTVQWIGRNRDVAPDGTYIVGIYTDDIIVGINRRFANKIVNMDHFIIPSTKHTRLFLPITCFISSGERECKDGYYTRQASKRQATLYWKNQDEHFEQEKIQEAMHNVQRKITNELVELEDIDDTQRKSLEEISQGKDSVQADQNKHNQPKLLQQIEDIDDTMLDPERQRKILERIGRDKNTVQAGQNKHNQPKLQQIEDIDDTMLDLEKQRKILEELSRSKGSIQDDQNRHNQSKLQQIENLSHNNSHAAQNASDSRVSPSGSSTYNQARNEMHPQPNYIPSSQLYVPIQMQQDRYNYQLQPGPHGQQLQHDQSHYPYQSITKHHEHFSQQPKSCQLKWDQQHQPWHRQQLEKEQQLQWDHRHQWEQQTHQQEWQQMDWQQQQRGQPVDFSNILRAKEDTCNIQYSTPPVQQLSKAHVFQEKPHVYEEISTPPWTIGYMIRCGDNPTRYGVIKWIGYLPGTTSRVAGIELDRPLNDSVNNNGTFDGHQYFQCLPRHGLFVNLSALRPDLRFSESRSEEASTVTNPLGEFHWDPDYDGETFYQALKDVKQHEGLGKGIQGHQNSGYLDSTLYGMFSYSEVFDDLLLKKQTTTDLVEVNTKKLLRQIVNLLRRRGVVHYNAIMSLRTALDKVLQLKGLKSETKDPEEFLNMLFKHVLHVEPFLQIRRPCGEDEEYFVQLFVEQNKNIIPNTQVLLCDMFLDQNISFVKYPLRLLMQIPRYGKRFKSFKGVIPSLELDVSVLCENFADTCFVCAQPGEAVCGECNKHEFNQVRYFCKRCFDIWHILPKRQLHKLIPRQATYTETGRLQLLSILCIETSQYVCFTRVTGYGKDEWVFFDSMAERPDDVHNMPKVTICTDELNEWVYGDKDLTQFTSKDLPPLARRFVEDGYLCIYVDHDGIMYGDEP